MPFSKVNLTLFITQGVYGIEPRRPHRGVDTKKHTYQQKNTK
jgi:hypothetical protein